MTLAAAFQVVPCLWSTVMVLSQVIFSWSQAVVLGLALRVHVTCPGNWYMIRYPRQADTDGHIVVIDSGVFERPARRRAGMMDWEILLISITINQAT